MSAWDHRQSDPPDGNVHVLPINDLREHAEHTTCWCKPVLDMHRMPGGRGPGKSGRPVLVVIHHALDGRELVEQLGLQ